MQHLILANKWRPKNFDEVIGQDHVVRVLSNALNQKRLHHAYLFTGTRGVGKTTIARILAKCFCCEKGISANPCGDCNSCNSVDLGKFIDLIEIDAASRTRVEDTKDLLENIHYLPTIGKLKIYIIDEVHMLSGHSFNALLKTLEEPPDHVKFLLATTEPQKLPVTILSRCLQFNLKNVDKDVIKKQLKYILDQEHIAYENSALEELSHSAKGSVRDALNLLDQAISYCNSEIINVEIQKMLGIVDKEKLFKLLLYIIENNAQKSLEIIREFYHLPIDFIGIIDELMEIMHQITIVQLIPDDTSSCGNNKFIQLLASKIKPEDTQLYYQILLTGKKDIISAPNSYVGFEMIVLRMIAFYPAYINDKENFDTCTSNIMLTNNEKYNTAIDNQLILQELDVSGMTKTLLQHCCIDKNGNDEIILLLDPNYAALFNKKYEERIGQAFSKHYNKKITVKIEIGSSNINTPDKTKKLENDNKKKLIDLEVHQNLEIQTIVDLFDAKIIDSSIK